MAAKRVELCKSLSFLHGRSNELIIHSVIRVQSSLETSLFQLGGVIEQTKSKVGGVGCSSMIFINIRKKNKQKKQKQEKKNKKKQKKKKKKKPKQKTKTKQKQHKKQKKQKNGHFM